MHYRMWTRALEHFVILPIEVHTLHFIYVYIYIDVLPTSLVAFFPSSLARSGVALCMPQPFPLSFLCGQCLRSRVVCVGTGGCACGA